MNADIEGTPLSVWVRGKGNLYPFRVRAHRSEGQADNRIEAAFYERWNGGIHAGVHYELQLVMRPPVKAVEGASHHIHHNPETGVDFICYPGAMPDLRTAYRILEYWSVGVVYAIEQEKDFNDVLAEHPRDFLQFMANTYDISIIEE